MDSVSVLLVDDSPFFLRSVAGFLEEYHSDEVVVVGTAGGGEEALTQVQELQPQVILLDLMMPGMTGLDVIGHLRAAQSEVRIIVLTLFDIDVYRQKALAVGADEFVAKSAVSTDLLPAIRRVTRAVVLEPRTVQSLHVSNHS